jgi:hypothetical protein
MPPQFNDLKEFAQNAEGKSWDEVWHWAREEKSRLLSFFEMPLQQLVDHPDYSAISSYENALRQLMIFLQSDTVPPSVTPQNRRLLERIRGDLKSRGRWRPRTEDEGGL